jgi:hypothetical protein
MEREQVGTRHRWETLAQSERQVVIGMRTVECLQEMLEGELEAIFLERLEVTQLISTLAFHLCLREGRLSENLKIEFEAGRKGLLEKAGAKLYGITVTAGIEGGPQTVEIAFDLGGTA